MAYSPAFQFYPGEYLGDKNTIPMTTEENGAYCLLMWVCWEQDGLPDDLEELADIARLSVEKFTPMWERRIKRCFFWDDRKKVFFHTRFVKEIKKQKEWKKKKSDAGKKGMETRWKQKTSDDNTVITPLGSVITDDNSSSPSSSPSSSASRSTTTTRLTDEAWLESLGASPAYEGIPVLLEFEKAQIWATTNNRQCTRRFFVNWLNKCKPIDVKTNGTNKSATNSKQSTVDKLGEYAEVFDSYPSESEITGIQ